ncbi:MAG: radical SAM protein [Desulfurococcales archaeon]|nr:radical SAM protein [Desulfurococcales archaeon]
MLRLVGTSDKGLYTSSSIASGCMLCYAGVKAVIFVTGVCDDSCYYCPVSRDRLGHDVFYVNEERVHTLEEVLTEVLRTGARGASITGGDPLIAYPRVTSLIRMLKDAMGPGFHIHLYTSGRYATIEALKGLDRAGLDEIRFHPTQEEFEDRIRDAVRHTSMDVGVEIPISPRLVEWAKRVIYKAWTSGAHFVNLNEMEFAEPNAPALLARGCRESRRRPFTVEGSYEAALEVLEWARENTGIPVHFCPASFKDSIQTRNRMRRAASLDRAWHEVETGDGTLRWYEADCPGGPVKAPSPGYLEGCRRIRLVEAHPTRARTPRIQEQVIEVQAPL